MDAITHRFFRSVLSLRYAYPSLHDTARSLLARRVVLLLAQKKQEVARLLLVGRRKGIVEREEGVALAVRGREGVTILLGRLGDEVERRRAEYCGQRLYLTDAQAGAGRFDSADVRATGANARAEIRLGMAISLAFPLDDLAEPIV